LVKTPTVQAQESSSIFLIGDEGAVWLGMSRENAIASLRDKYTLTSADGDSNLTDAFWIGIQKKGSPRPANVFTEVGALYFSFRDGKLIEADRKWATTASNAGIDQLWDGFEAALSPQLPFGKWTSAQIRPLALKTTETETQGIDIRIGNRSVTLS
jgi:hypothetical protein